MTIHARSVRTASGLGDIAMPRSVPTLQSGEEYMIIRITQRSRTPPRTCSRLMLCRTTDSCMCDGLRWQIRIIDAAYEMIWIMTDRVYEDSLCVAKPRWWPQGVMRI